MKDLIERQAAIDKVQAIEYLATLRDGDVVVRMNDVEHILYTMPSAQSEEFEWCHDCKEYDQAQHCCHRWTKVIRQTVAEIKAKQPDFDTVAEIDKAHDDGYKQGYLQGKVDYEPKTGKWIRDAVWYTRYHCSQCGEKTEDTVMGRPRYNFCPHCGARMLKEGE